MKEKSKTKAKPQQAAGDEEIKKRIRQDLVDLADKLKCLAARFEICGFMPSVGQYAKQISHEALDLFGDITFKIWLGEDGKKYASRKTLSQDDAYARDLLLIVNYLTEEKYLRNADPQQASIEMMRVADLIQKDFLILQKHEGEEKANLGKPTKEQKKLAPCHQLALDSFVIALSEKEALLRAKLDDIYNWLMKPENLEDNRNPYKDIRNKPKLKTWKSYLRFACDYYDGTSTDEIRERAEKQWLFEKSKGRNTVYPKDIKPTV